MASKFARAGDGATVSVQGFAELQRALTKIETGVQAEMRARLRAIGEKVALVAADNAPRRTGELQHSIKTSVETRGASVYSNAPYGGAVNYGAFPHAGKEARGPHITRAGASHYMDRAVTELAPWVEQETNAVLDWVITTFETE